MDIKCPHCQQEIDAPAAMAGQIADCPGCNCKISIPVPQAAMIEPVAAVPDTRGKPLDFSKAINANSTGHALKCSSSFGGGCLLQGIGIIAGLVGLIFIPTIIMPVICFPLAIWLLIAGTNMSTWYECSKCRSKVQKSAKVCSRCNTTLSL